MNVELRERHMADMTDAATGEVCAPAAAVYDMLCAACARRPEGMSDPDQCMIGDIAMLEALKIQLYADIRKRGVVENYHNGRQRLMRENKSIQSAKAMIEQQRKLLAELRLTPNSRKAAQISIDDGFADF